MTISNGHSYRNLSPSSVHFPRLARLAVAFVIVLAACSSPSERELQRLALRVDSLAKAVTALGRASGKGAPPAIRPAATRITGSLREGDPTSPLVLVEFTDYFCPFCGTWAVTHLPELTGGYARDVGLEVVVRNYPIKEIHPQATRVASLVECAAATSPTAGWDLYRKLYARGESLDSTGRDALVRASGISAAAADNCFSARGTHPQVVADVAEASRLGIRGTPTFILGRRVGTDSVSGILLDGAYPAKEIKRLIDSLRAVGR